jgi:EmrB/QacA subfamily drug resistance transporter
MTERPRSSGGLDRRTLVVAGVVILGSLMSILDTTIVNVALEALARDLHAPLHTIQWVATGYLLSLAMVIPLAGWMSERFGSKRVWLGSVAAFAIGSMLCGRASSAAMLIGFRALQGVGGGLIMPVGMSVLAQTAGPARMGRVMSVVGAPMLMGPVLGPLIGGLILETVSWRWIFYVNVPIAVVALVLGARLLDGDTGRADAGRLDWAGLALLSPGLAAVVFGLSQMETGGGAGSPSASVPLVGGAVLVALFVRHAARAPRPLIDVRLFRSPVFALAASTTALVGAATFGALLLLPLYFQEARGAAPLTAGLLMVPQGIGAAVAIPLAGRLVDRIGGGRVAVVGCAVMALATVPLAAVGAGAPVAWLHAVLFVRGLGLGASMMPTMAAAFAELDAAQIPRATAALNALQRIGGSVGTALLAVVLEHQARAGPLAAAFGHTFAWAAALAVLASVSAAALAIAQRSPEPRHVPEPSSSPP